MRPDAVEGQSILSPSVAVLVLSVVSMTSLFLYSLYRGESRAKILGWMLVYVGLLPTFVGRAFDLPGGVELPLLLAGIGSMIVGFGVVWWVE